MALLSFSASVNCQYEVKPYEEGTPLSNTTGADGTYASYWDLPLNVKILDLIVCLIAFIATLKMLPIVIGKLKNIFDNRNRNIINTHIREKPGSTIREISNDKKISYTTTRYHIFMLERAGKIILLRVGKIFSVFPMGVYNDKQKKVIRHLNNENGKSILYSIIEMPGITNHELAVICGIEKSSIHWHIERMLRDNIIRSEKDGKFVRYYIRDEVKDELQKLIPMFTENSI